MTVSLKQLSLMHSLRTVHVQRNDNEIRLADNAALAIRGELKRLLLEIAAACWLLQSGGISP
jgi:hypothetical protein